MPFITRADGEHFVIPSYRDSLTAKNASTLKKEVLLLSQSYGNNITMQKRSPTQYEVAFSSDTGYLLGESVWQHFKRPLDMVYCEAVPNTSEAIMVIVKAGTVHLDGSFQKDSIPEELIVFLTQENNFDIYIYGDVPISKEHEAGKFSFEPSSVKSFNVLDEPVFPTLPLLKIYQLRPVDTVLQEQGIGVLPVGKIVGVLILLALLYGAYSFITRPKPVPPPPKVAQPPPLLGYMTDLTSPTVEDHLKQVLVYYRLLMTMPGWVSTGFSYADGGFNCGVTSNGGTVQQLMEWAKNNDVNLDMQNSGYTISKSVTLPNRAVPTVIYPLKQLIAEIVDRMGRFYPGNHFSIEAANKGAYSDAKITLNFDGFSPAIVMLMGQQINKLPVVVRAITIRVDHGLLSGTMVFDALGSG